MPEEPEDPRSVIQQIARRMAAATRGNDQALVVAACAYFIVTQMTTPGVMPSLVSGSTSRHAMEDLTKAMQKDFDQRMSDIAKAQAAAVAASVN